MADSAVKRFFKVSCLGCLSIGIAAVATVLIFGWISGRNAEFTDASASYGPERLGGTAPLDAADPDRSADLSEPLGAPVNRVRLLVDGIETVELRPCAQGEDLTVEATYNKKRVEFSERLEQEQDGGWTYTVDMTGSGSQLARTIERLFSGRGSSLDVCLPADTPMALQAEMSSAGLEAELGGLWLTTVEFQLEMGGVIVGFDAPLREPAESVSVGVNMGGIVLQGVGNASPAVLEVDYRFSGGVFDMRGDWKQDAQIELDGSAGGVTVILPRSVRVEGVPDLGPAAQAAGETAPTLFFAPGTDFEDITVERR